MQRSKTCEKRENLKRKSLSLENGLFVSTDRSQITNFLRFLAQSLPEHGSVFC